MDEFKAVLDVVSAAMRKRGRTQLVMSRMQQARPVCAVPNCAGCRLVDEVFAQAPLVPHESRPAERERFP